MLDLILVIVGLMGLCGAVHLISMLLFYFSGFPAVFGASAGSLLGKSSKNS